MHTRGPWQVGKRYGNNRTEVLSPTGGRAICSVWTHERRSKDKQPAGDGDYEANQEGLGNLQLITASPELLARLVELVHEVRTMAHALHGGRSARDHALADGWMKHVHRADAAIEKATGET